jgi:hypothetical protein
MSGAQLVTAQKFNIFSSSMIIEVRDCTEGVKEKANETNPFVLSKCRNLDFLRQPRLFCS